MVAITLKETKNKEQVYGGGREGMRNHEFQAQMLLSFMEDAPIIY